MEGRKALLALDALRKPFLKSPVFDFPEVLSEVDPAEPFSSYGKGEESASRITGFFFPPILFSRELAGEPPDPVPYERASLPFPPCQDVGLSEILHFPEVGLDGRVCYIFFLLIARCFLYFLPPPARHIAPRNSFHVSSIPGRRPFPAAGECLLLS